MKKVNVLFGILAFVIVVFTITGNVQQLIKFEGAINEMMFCLFFFLIGLSFMVLSFCKK